MKEDSIEDYIAGEIVLNPKSIDDYLTRIPMHNYESLAELEGDLDRLSTKYKIERQNNKFWDLFYQTTEVLKYASLGLVPMVVLPFPLNFAGWALGSAAAIYLMFKKAKPELERKGVAADLHKVLTINIGRYKEQGVGEDFILSHAQKLASKFLARYDL